MTRSNLFLLLVVLASAMFLVRTQYESRKLTIEIESARAEASRLETEHDRLDLESRTQATSMRVDRLARDLMQMRSITPDITIYVSDPGLATAPKKNPETKP